MARIRSIHDGFFTDERLVSVSSFARLLFLGLGVQADDKGVFEWKPITLKMRIFPADNVDVVDLLAELEGIDAIQKYEIDGRQYGAIRNFRKFQRPKSPNDVHPITDEFRTYVGLLSPASEIAVADDVKFPQNGEIAPQMEDGGGRGEESRGVIIVDDDAGAKAAKPPKSYVFEATKIKLTATDLEKWRQAFPLLSLEAELWSLDEWAGKQGKNWFSAVSSALAKKQREATERANAAKANREVGGGTRSRRDGRI
ncbi:hypothetical protein N183_12085 [Sinorhizobium sp. Sb3]|uniref:hypothetical protein n=1 Tax=Sinorhizobium sp. Sb3 TaxID=1358417 RepID=UPI00071C5ED5|nr:hypothetical protein [Sinorhizobium sp. Sb3]KSV84558.1 hypothetical protein N183_12085 [Sinorhizobium sp. Sb3]